MEARVKQDYRFGNVSALVGRRFDKKNWTPIPPELEAEAKAHPFLDIRGEKVAPVPVEEPVKQAVWVERRDEAFPFEPQAKTEPVPVPHTAVEVTPAGLPATGSADKLAAEKGFKTDKATHPGRRK